MSCPFVLGFRMESKARNSDIVFKPYPAPDGDYAYANGDALNPAYSTANGTLTGSSRRYRSPRGSVHTDDLCTFKPDPNSDGQSFDATSPSAAILNADQQRRHTAAEDSVDQDAVDMCYVPDNRNKTAHIFEMTPMDETETGSEHDLCQIEGYDMDDLSDDEMTLENDMYDQSSFTF